MNFQSANKTHKKRGKLLNPLCRTHPVVTSQTQLRYMILLPKTPQPFQMSLETIFVLSVLSWPITFQVKQRKNRMNF